MNKRTEEQQLWLELARRYSECGVAADRKGNTALAFRYYDLCREAVSKAGG